MNKYLVVCDTTSAMNLEMAKEEGIELIPLSVIINGQAYRDQYEISSEAIYQRLKEGAVPSTSMPSTGLIMEYFEKWEKEHYDAIIILTCSSDLSGANHGYHLVKDELEAKNVYIVDTRSIGAPIMDAARRTKEMLDEGQDLDIILRMLDVKFKNSFSFLFPANLTQIKKSGRISPLAANMASVLRIKPLLYLKEDATIVDRFGLVRTEGKLIQMIVDKFNDLGVNSKDYKIYISHADNIKSAERVNAVLKAIFEGIETEIVVLPSVLTCHGGLGCVSVQTTFKI